MTPKIEAHLKFTGYREVKVSSTEAANLITQIMSKYSGYIRRFVRAGVINARANPLTYYEIWLVKFDEEAQAIKSRSIQKQLDLDLSCR